ncbi:hypothetical protein [Longimicrobium sp.]|uniref:hypothetical protein n=1 Tax=Longimicrobium sp. TaxID=2029185 RepID=UPI003B3BA3FD
MNRILLALALAVVCLAPRTAAAQNDSTPRPFEVRGDTLMPSVPDSLLPISPRSAFLRSLVLPGWGQSELGAPGRGGVYFMLEAGSLWMVLKTNQKLGEARRLETIARETGEIGPTTKLPLVRDRENQREDWITLSIFWLFFSGADAFVAAHLQDFDVHVNAVPRPGGGTELRATVPVGP